MTVLASYRESQKLINEAEALVRAGEEGKARPLFARAAQAEWEFVHDLSQEKVRSRAIFGFSAADYYLRAGQLDEAEKVAAFLLEQASLEPYSHEVVRRFLGRVWDERMLRISHLQIEGSYFSVLLRDGEVGYGLAPFDVIERAMRLGWGYLNRFAAFLVDIDWTRKLPIDAIQERYRAFVAPAQAGSYRLDFVLATPLQLSLDVLGGSAVPEPKEVIGTAIEFARAATEADEQRLRELVPRDDYRAGLANIVRSLAPKDRSVREVELRQDGAPPERGVKLHREQIEPLTRVIRSIKYPEAGDSGRSGTGGAPVLTDELQGILRAVDLDSGRLRLDLGGGGVFKFKCPEHVSDDALGPMLNHAVRVVRMRRGEQPWRAADVIPAAEGEPQSGGPEESGERNGQDLSSGKLTAERRGVG